MNRLDKSELQCAKYTDKSINNIQTENISLQMLKFVNKLQTLMYRCGTELINPHNINPKTNRRCNVSRHHHNNQISIIRRILSKLRNKNCH